MEARLTTARVAAGCQVYWPAPYEVCGLIRDKYNQLSGPNSFLTFPKSNELTNPDRVGKRSEFLGGNIYWHPSVTARPVAHDFLAKWGDHGYESGFLKYPTTDEIVMPGGRRQEFQGGTIYYSPQGGAHNVQGKIREKYLSLGGPVGSNLGYPISDELNNGYQFYNKFEKGTIFWSPAGTEVVENPFGWAKFADEYEDCNIYQLSDCKQEGKMTEIIAGMQDCQYNGDIPDNYPVLSMYQSPKGFPSPMHLTCARYRHIIYSGHRPDKDTENFITCLVLVYTRGNPWDGAHDPNLGIAWQNGKANSHRWAYISYRPAAGNQVWSAYTGGDAGADWGGCARGWNT
ncbi:hypothetical protein QSJ19_26045 [Gordonia sp. ABSL11-1]|uniref:LGFP repeat-containing protein n=1 Tax=Gordonia sp. ABSL11-1 TaxID=3053924 RepID=UPI00257407F9|nr:hypothetical protein [Gordonia sp. ABSL11-1]MDL9948979.1 hypothetical protein [Gordonia sp. ABSL11-1]